MRNPLPMVKLLWGSYKLVKDPNRLDEVIELADSISSPEVMDAFVQAIRATPEGARALAERPRVHVEIAALRQLPPGSFGRELAEMLVRNRLDPDDLPTRPANDEEEFVRAHLFETHDIWHVVTGFGTDVAGELGLQAFYLAQLPARLAPLLLGVGLLNTMLYAFDDKDRRMDQVALGWQLGREARQLFGTDWNALFPLPLAQVRARFGIPATGVGTAPAARLSMSA